MITKKQKEFAHLIGIDTNDDNENVLYARIIDFIDQNIFNKINTKKLSEKQIAFALKHGIDITNENYSVGNVIIDQIMEKLDMESINRQDLKVGDKVYMRDHLNNEYVISSIKEGIVYFKGGNGAKAHARNIVK